MKNMEKDIELILFIKKSGNSNYLSIDKRTFDLLKLKNYKALKVKVIDTIK